MVYHKQQSAFKNLKLQNVSTLSEVDKFMVKQVAYFYFTVWVVIKLEFQNLIDSQIWGQTFFNVDSVL